VIVAVGVLLLAVGAESALGLVPVKTNTTIIVTALDPTTATYSGKVTTKLAKKAQDQGLKGARKCRRARAVEVSYLGSQIGKAVTDADGDWSVTGAKPPPGADVKVLVSRDVRGDVLCGVISKHSAPIP